MRTFYALSAAGVLFAAALVGCNQPTDNSATDTTSETTVEATTVDFANTKCPMMGGKPSSELTATYVGKTIGFCCEGCPEKWAALSDEEKAERFAKVSKKTHSNQSDHEADEGHADHDHADHS